MDANLIKTFKPVGLTDYRQEVECGESERNPNTQKCRDAKSCVSWQEDLLRLTVGDARFCVSTGLVESNLMKSFKPVGCQIIGRWWSVANPNGTLTPRNVETQNLASRDRIICYA